MFFYDKNTKMDIDKAIQILEYHQQWRRDKNVPALNEMQKPALIGNALDTLIAEVKNSRLEGVSDSMPIVEHLGKTYKPRIAYYGTEWEAWYESEGIRIPQDVLYNKYGSNLIETVTALVNEIKSKGLYCYS